MNLQARLNDAKPSALNPQRLLPRFPNYPLINKNCIATPTVGTMRPVLLSVVPLGSVPNPKLRTLKNKTLMPYVNTDFSSLYVQPCKSRNPGKGTRSVAEAIRSSYKP